MTGPLSDRRAAATAGVLVAAVVIVLGFGSGIGAVLSRSNGRAGTGTASGHDLGTVVQDGGPVSASSSAPAGRAATTTSSRSSGSVRTAPMQHADDGGPSSTPPPSNDDVATGNGASPASTSTTTTTCRGSSLAAAMVDPFVVHFDKAHLETSPGEQVGAALEPDSYVKMHTVLVEDMVAPGVDTILASLTGIRPFVAHVDKAHLEASPGQQISDLLDTDTYIRTHTVLVEDMAAPTMHELTDYGCP